jgi:hypothetical protein
MTQLIDEVGSFFAECEDETAALFARERTAVG